MLSRAVGRIHPTTEYLRNGPPIHLHSTVLETRWFKNVTASVDYGSDLPRLKAMTSFTQHRGSTLWLRFNVRLPSLIRRPTGKKTDDQPVIIMPRLRMFPIRSTHLPNNHFYFAQASRPLSPSSGNSNNLSLGVSIPYILSHAMLSPTIRSPSGSRHWHILSPCTVSH